MNEINHHFIWLLKTTLIKVTSHSPSITWKVRAPQHVHAHTQSCSTLCDPMDYSPPGSSVHGTSQARILEWVAMPSSGDLPDPGIKPTSLYVYLQWQADSLPLASPAKPIIFILMPIKGMYHLNCQLIIMNP